MLIMLSRVLNAIGNRVNDGLLFEAVIELGIIVPFFPIDSAK